MKDLYLVRRDVLDRIHQNPNAVPIVYPDELGAILSAADAPAIARDAATRLGLPALSADALNRLTNLDKQGFIDRAIKGNRDLIGFMDKRDYVNDSAESRATWEILWEAMSNWDNRQWNWPQIAVGAALAEAYCPVVVEREQVVLSRGSTAH